MASLNTGKNNVSNVSFSPNTNTNYPLTRNRRQKLEYETMKDVLIETLGVCAVAGYEAEVNQSIGLCKDARKDFHLLISCANTNIRSYSSTYKHRIMYSCMTGNVDWFRTLYALGNKNDIISLRTADEKCLYHLLTMNPNDIDDEDNQKNVYSTWDGTEHIQWDDKNDYIIHPEPLANIPDRIRIMNILTNTALSLDTKDINGNTCLHLAIKFKEEEMFSIFLQHLLTVFGAYKINIVNKRGQSLLHVAITANNANIVKQLCPLEGINMNIGDSWTRSPLEWACIKGRTLIVQELLRYKDKFDINYHAEGGHTVVWLAALNKHADIVQLLYEAGCNMNSQGSRGNTIVHDVIYYCDLHMLKYLITIPTVNLDIKNNEGHTPLFLAIYLGEVAIVRELVQHLDRIDINGRNNQGHSALYASINAGGDPTIPSILINAGIDVDDDSSLLMFRLLNDQEI